MPRKANNAYCHPRVEIQWEVFLENRKTVDALIQFIEGQSNNQQLRTACPSAGCQQAVDRMRRLGNYESRERARRFLREHYTW